MCYVSPIMCEPQTAQARIYIDTKHHEILKAICQSTNRGLGAQVEVLIAQELKRQQNPSESHGGDNDKPDT